MVATHCVTFMAANAEQGMIGHAMMSRPPHDDALFRAIPAGLTINAACRCQWPLVHGLQMPCNCPAVISCNVSMGECNYPSDLAAIPVRSLTSEKGAGKLFCRALL